MFSRERIFSGSRLRQVVHNMHRGYILGRVQLCMVHILAYSLYTLGCSVQEGRKLGSRLHYVSPTLGHVHELKDAMFSDEASGTRVHVLLISGRCFHAENA